MKPAAVYFAMAIVLVSILASSAQAQTQPSRLVLTVTSTHSTNAHIPFSISYAEGDSTGFAPLKHFEPSTPFELELQVPRLFALISDSTRGQFVVVTLTRFEDGRAGTRVSGQGSLNVLSADGQNLSYGWPKMVRELLHEKQKR